MRCRLYQCFYSIYDYINICLSIAIKGPIIRGAVTRQNESDSAPTRSGWRGTCDCLPGRDGRDGVQGRDGRDGMQGAEGPSVEHLVPWDHLDHLERMGED